MIKSNMSQKSLNYFDKILFELKKDSKTISQISNKLKLNFDSVKSYMLQLEHLGLIIKNKEGKDYKINPNPQSRKDFGTYFNLPIEEDIKEKIETLYFLIKNEWIKITNTKPTITQVYKTLAKLDDVKNLNLPIGWYNYGKVPILVYKEEQVKEEVFIDNDIKEEISNIVIDYSKFTTIRKLLKNQYDDFNKKTYQLKEILLDNFYYNKEEFVTKDMKNNFQEFIKSIVRDNIDRNLTAYLDEFYNHLLHFNEVQKTAKEDFYQYKEALICTFKEIFKLLALDYYKLSLREFYEGTEEILEISFERDIKLQKLEVEEKLSETFKIIESNVEKSKIYRTYFMSNNFQEFPRISEEDLQSEEEQKQMLKEMGLD